MTEYFNYSRLYHDIFGNGLMPLSFPYCIEMVVNGEFHYDTLTDDEKFLIKEYHKSSTYNWKIHGMSKGIRRRRYYTAIRKLRTKPYRDLLKYGIVNTITTRNTNSFWDIFDQLDKSINRSLVRAGINTITDLIDKSDEELLDIRGIGPKKLEMINQVKSRFTATNKMIENLFGDVKYNSWYERIFKEEVKYPDEFKANFIWGIANDFIVPHIDGISQTAIIKVISDYLHGSPMGVISRSTNMDIRAIRLIVNRFIKICNTKKEFFDKGIISTEYVVLPAELQFQMAFIQHDIPMDIYLRLTMSGITTIDEFIALKTSELHYLHNDFDIICILEKFQNLLSTAREDK